jgi:hypothetical protein
MFTQTNLLAHTTQLSSDDGERGGDGPAVVAAVEPPLKERGDTGCIS